VQIWILSCHGFTAPRGDEAVICCHENQRWQVMSDKRLIDNIGRSQLHRIICPQRMALDKFDGNINDPWLSWDDAILRGAVGSEGRDQLISFVQRDDAFASASGKCTGSSARVMSAILMMLAEAGSTMVLTQSEPTLST
jgi:hypothetical protein